MVHVLIKIVNGACSNLLKIVNGACSNLLEIVNSACSNLGGDYTIFLRNLHIYLYLS